MNVLELAVPTAKLTVPIARLVIEDKRLNRALFKQLSHKPLTTFPPWFADEDTATALAHCWSDGRHSALLSSCVLLVQFKDNPLNIVKVSLAYNADEATKNKFKELKNATQRIYL